MKGKKGEERVKSEEKDMEVAIAATWEKGGEKWLWGKTYMRHKRKEVYKKMEEWIEKNNESLIIINGDFNAKYRKGNKQEKRQNDK